MDSQFNSILEKLDAELEILPDKPKESASGTLKSLWLLAQGTPCTVETAATATLTPLDDRQLARLNELVSKRLSGIPLAHLTGLEEFMGIEMSVSTGALIPRKETEILANAIRSIFQENSPHQSRPKVLDLCTGVGNIAVYIAKEFPNARVLASDLSSDAIAAAIANAEHCGCGEIDFQTSDMFSAFEREEFYESFDLISCNPPYISQAKVEAMDQEISRHEPKAAFDGGPLGVSILMKLISEAHRFLAPSGWVVFEIGLGQGPAMSRRIGKQPSYQNVKTFLDEQGQIRVIAFQKKPDQTNDA